MAGTDLERFTKLMLAEFGRVHERLDKHDDRFDAIDDGLDKVNREFQSLHAELRSIRSDLDDIREKLENVIGYRKEIDHALERIAAIEKHLGIERKIAA